MSICTRCEGKGVSPLYPKDTVVCSKCGGTGKAIEVREQTKSIPDGVILSYVKDGVVYPVAMTESEYGMLQRLVKVFEPLRVASDQPQGKAVNISK